MPVQVKICGITSLDDALGCVDLGVDVLGFNFWPGSKRCVSVERAREIGARVPSSVQRVGVFVRAPASEVRGTAEAVGLSAIQLHGDEDPGEYLGAGAPLWQVLRIRDASSFPSEPSAAARAFLLDARVEGFGGSGRAFDWRLATRVRAWGRPVWLAGGLNAENVAEAIAQAGPDGVDVASGVEQVPGRKDLRRVAAFMAAVRGAEDVR